eukprot:902235-Amorphochlora_amoeboformis.AAC.1
MASSPPTDRKRRKVCARCMRVETVCVCSVLPSVKVRKTCFPDEFDAYRVRRRLDAWYSGIISIVEGWGRTGRKS